MNIFKKINYKRIGYHILFWLVVNITYDLFSSYTADHEFITTFLSDFLYYTPSQVFTMYITLYVLFPAFLYKRKYLLFFATFLLFFSFTIVFIAVPMRYLDFKSYFISDNIEPNYIEFLKYSVLKAVNLNLMIVGVASAIKLSKKWIKTQQEQQVLINEKLAINLKLKEAELKFLKSQINPHFLFNALNNLYSLTLEKSDKAPDVVLKIASMLDYVLYECNVPYIDLEREIENIKNYIDLEKIRYGEEAKVNFYFPEDFAGIKIAPLIFLPYIENAFKHGLTENLGKGEININLQIKYNKVIFTVINSMSESKTATDNKHQGIGLENVAKRLKLQYKNKHKLKIKKEDKTFSVYLELIICDYFDKLENLPGQTWIERG